MIHTTANLLDMDFGDPFEASGAIVREGCRVFDTDVGFVAKLDDDGSFECVANHGEIDSGVIEAVGRACAGTAEPVTRWCSGDAIAAGPGEALDRVALHVGSLIACPIRVDSQTWGFVAFTSARPRTADWTDEQRASIRVFAGLCRLHHVQMLSVLMQRERASKDLRLILDHIPSFVFFKDDKNTILQANKAAAESLGQTPEDLVGRASEDFYEHADLYLADDLEVLKRGEPKLGYVEPYATPEGLRYIQTDKVPVSDGSGGPNRILAIATDITDRVLADEARLRYEDALRAAKNEAEAADRSKSEFLANMSHEIRTPMSAIIGYSDLMLDPEQSHEDRTESLYAIRRNGEHLLSLINDILDLAKVETGQLHTESSPVDVSEVLEEVVATMRPLARNKDIDLQRRHSSKLPRKITTDPLRLRQIVLNLVNNAVKFTERGGVTVDACVLYPGDNPTVKDWPAAPDHAVLRITVKDTGIGMLPEHTAKVFDPFQQADRSMTRRFGGTGLGLAISRHLAEHLGGKITLTSELGVGTKVTLTLDIGGTAELDMIDPKPTSQTDPAPTETTDASTAPVATPTPLPVPSKPATTTGKPLEGVSVLLAEDGLDNQRIISAFLTAGGADVTLAANGQAALEAVLMGRKLDDDAPPFDVVLMDMQMPVLDGYGATAELRERGFKQPIIALTAHAMADEPDRCAKAGCDLYLSKPIGRAALVQAVAEMVARGEAETPSYDHVRSGMADDADFAPVLRAFIDRLPQIATDMQLTLVADDTETLRRLAHQLKGAGGSYDMPQITTVAQKLWDVMEADPDAPTLEAAVNEMVALLRRVEGFDDTKTRDAA